MAEQVDSIVAVSPAQPRHVHVVPSAVDSASEYIQGGHSFVAAQQPLLPTLEPSSHVVAEAPAAKTKTITNAASLRPEAIESGERNDVPLNKRSRAVEIKLKLL